MANGREQSNFYESSRQENRVRYEFHLYRVEIQRNEGQAIVDTFKFKSYCFRGYSK